MLVRGAAGACREAHPGREGEVPIEIRIDVGHAIDGDGNMGCGDHDAHLVPARVFHFGKCGPYGQAGQISVEIERQMVLARGIDVSVVVGVDLDGPPG